MDLYSPEPAPIAEWSKAITANGLLSLNIVWIQNHLEAWVKVASDLWLWAGFYSSFKTSYNQNMVSVCRKRCREIYRKKSLTYIYHLFLNPSNAKATFVLSTRTQRFLKNL